MTVAVNDRVKDGNEWKDGEPTYYEVSCWRQYAENVAESVTKGTRVVVMGKLKARTYETRDGSKRTVFDVQADEIGLSLRYSSAQSKAAQRTTPRQSQPADDPWATPSPLEDIPF
jgi:single-strand DNA-binding protein